MPDSTPPTAPSASSSPTTGLLTDRYELTMLQAGLRSGAAHRRSVFEVFARRLPAGRRYGVTAGAGRLLEDLASFRFADDQIGWLRDSGVVDAGTAVWLERYRFSGSIWGYAEGECYVPGSPILVVEGTFAEAVLLETIVLSVLNHDSAVAAAASRMTSAAGDRPCLEMGSRRTHEDAAVAAARAAAVGGFASTSNLEAGRRYGLPTVGTAAHAFMLLHDDERSAFEAQVASLGSSTTLLVDTYDVEQAVRLAVEVAGTSLGAVRLDSGDLLVQARAVRDQLDALGATGTRIVVTSDLDEHAVASLTAGPVDAYGVGTSLVTGSGAPTAGLVYKLVAREDSSGELVGVAKSSPGKVGDAGRKWARRRTSGGVATTEVLSSTEVRASTEVPASTEVRASNEVQASAENSGDGDRPLLIPLVVRGGVDADHTGPGAVQRARARHASSLAELPASARRLSRGEPCIPTELEEPPR